MRLDGKATGHRLLAFVLGAATLACGSDDARNGDTGSTGTDATDGAPMTSTSGTAGDESGSDTEDSQTDDSWHRPRLRRLTQLQYGNSLQALFGDELILSPSLEPDTKIGLFSSVGAGLTQLSNRGVEHYDSSAISAVAQVFNDPRWRSSIVGCEPSESDCVDGFLREFGARIWRRPLTDAEVLRYRSVHDTVNALHDGDNWSGLAYTVAGMLSSPNFVYLVEVGEPDPEQDGVRRYTSVEMASRLSYLLWNGPPDAELRSAGDAGELLDPKTIQAQAARLLADPRGREGVAVFFSEFLSTDDTENVTKDEEFYPSASLALLSSMRGEVDRLTADIVFERDNSILDLLDTQETFIDTELAALYGLNAPESTDADGFARVTLPASESRRGVLGTGAFLAAFARQSRTSPTLRGLFVVERLLCREIPPPPPDAEGELAEPGPQAGTMREQLEAHRNNPSCAACHELVDPMGLALEHFDGLGTHRDTDEGRAIDASGSLDGVEFVGLDGLAQTLRDNPAVGLCFTEHLYQYAVGVRPEPGEDEYVRIEALGSDFVDQGHRLQALLLQLVVDPGFRTLGPSTSQDDE